MTRDSLPPSKSVDLQMPMHLMTVLPLAGGGGYLSRNSTKENRTSTTSLPVPGNRPVNVEPDTARNAMPVDDRIPLYNSSLIRQSGSHTDSRSAFGVPPMEPRLPVGQIAEAGHKATKAIYDSRVGHRHSIRCSAGWHQEQADMTMALKARILALERSERRLKSRLLDEKESLKDTKADVQAAQYQASILEERIDNEVEAQKQVVAELERYRGWWLNEYYCLKVALQMIADPDDGVAAMQESSRARYMIHLASQSDSV